MDRLDKVQTLFFDFDGTIHNSIKIYAPAFRKAYDFLVEEGFAEKRIWSEDEISHWLGYTSKNMWKEFMPDLDEVPRKKAGAMVGNTMRFLMEERKAELYEGSLETLDYLKKEGYNLVFLSNCSASYRDKANEIFGLDKYFDDLVCAEDYSFIPKHEILKKIKDKYPGEKAIVGDRIHDMEAGKLNNIKSIGCTYGFGSLEELKDADVIIDDVKKLKEIL
jgi:phosphoglycolate phosphatase